MRKKVLGENSHFELFSQLRELTKAHQPGTQLALPEALSAESLGSHSLSYFEMGGRHSVENPDSPKVIMIHGFGGFFMDWPRIMKPVSRRYHVMAVDLPGWGFTDPWPQNKAVEDDVEVIKRFIEKKGFKKVYLVGVSYGAAVSWAVAASKIPQVERLLLLNPMPPFPLKYMNSPIYRGIFMANKVSLFSRSMNRMMTKKMYARTCEETVRHKRLIESGYLDLGFLVIKQPKIGRTIHLFAQGAHYIDWKAWENRIREINIPVTIMQGLDDKVFSLEGAQYLHSLMPHSRLIEVKDCGHAMVFDQHRKVSAYIVYHWDQDPVAQPVIAL